MFVFLRLCEYEEWVKFLFVLTCEHLAPTNYFEHGINFVRSSAVNVTFAAWSFFFTNDQWHNRQFALLHTVASAYTICGWSNHGHVFLGE